VLLLFTYLLTALHSFMIIRKQIDAQQYL
jgi:hypothetical protein